MMTTTDLMPTVTAERRAFSDVLEGLPESDWNAPSLCSGWRVREVVAHMTMPFRYAAPRFLGEMVRSRGNFARMADRVARRDSQAPIGTLLDGWRTNEDHPWKPPRGGLQGALTHDVVHGLGHLGQEVARHHHRVPLVGLAAEERPEPVHARGVEAAVPRSRPDGTAVTSAWRNTRFVIRLIRSLLGQLGSGQATSASVDIQSFG